MIRPLSFVLLNYGTRPMVWVMAAVYLLTLVATLSGAFSDWNASRQAAYPGMENWGTPFSLNAPQALKDLAQGRLEFPSDSAEIDWPTAVLVAEGPSTLIQRLQTVHSLHALSIRSMIGFKDADLQSLGDIQQLQAISLFHCDVTDEVWRQLGRLPNLRYLDLSGCHLHGDYPGLESLARLETLVLGSPVAGGIAEHDAPLLPQLHRLPHLQTLVLGSSYSPSLSMPQVQQQLPDTAPQYLDPIRNNIEQFRVITSLQTLFVDEHPRGQADLNQLQSLLPQIKVRPSFIDSNRQLSFLAIFVLNCVVLFLVAIQLQSQFSQASCHLIPGYLWPHLTPPIVLFVASLPLHCVPLLMHDVPLGAALGVTLFCWVLVCVPFLISSLGQMARKLDHRIMTWIMIPVAITGIAWMPMVIALIQWSRSSIDWYLRGNEPAWAILFVIAGFAAAVVSLQQATRLFATYAERGISSPPISLDPVQVAQWQQQVYWQNITSKSRGWFGRRLEDTVANSRRTGWRPRSDLWIAGNMPTGPAILLMASFGAGMMIYGSWTRSHPLFSDIGRQLRTPEFLLMTAFLPDIILLPIAAIWRNRRKMFAMESLRPLSRLEFARQIAVAVAWNLSPLALIYTGVLTWYVVHADANRWTLAWTGAMALVFVARWCLAYGMTLWCITIRRDWVMVLVAVSSGYAVLCANLVIIFLQAPVLGINNLPPDMPDISTAMLTGMAFSLGLVACGVTRTAYRRWQRIELV